MPETSAVQVEKRCACGRAHTPESFSELQLKGWCGFFWAGGRARAIELRNCACGSTLGMECEAPKKILRANAEIRGVAA